MKHLSSLAIDSLLVFNTIFELQQLENFSISRIHEFKHLISCEIPKLTTFEEDIKKASYKLGQWISNEGNTRGTFRNLVR